MADLLVHEGHQTVVRGPRPADFFLAQLVHAAHPAPQAQGRVQAFQVPGRHLRDVDLVEIFLVQVPGTDEGAVGQDIADHQAKGLVRVAAGLLFQKVTAGPGDRHIVGLVRGAARPGHLHGLVGLAGGGHGDVPQVRGGPAGEGTQDIPDEAPLESVALVRPDKVHAAPQDGLVPGGPQAVREGGNVRGQGAAVGPDLDVGAVAAGQESHPRGHAERGRAVGVVEEHPAFGQAIQVRSADESIAPAAEVVRVVLVRDDHQEVRSGGHGQFSRSSLAAREWLT